MLREKGEEGAGSGAVRCGQVKPNANKLSKKRQHKKLHNQNNDCCGWVTEWCGVVGWFLLLLLLLSQEIDNNKNK